MIDRGAIGIKYKQAAIDWLNVEDSNKSGCDLSLEDANEDGTLYLIPEESTDSPEDLENWLVNNYLEIFETELESWYVDSRLWPKNRTIELFKKWFSLEGYSMIIDMGKGPIFDDE